MPFAIRLTCDIAAPAATVWNVIVDLPAYADWNPFVVGCDSTLVAGSPIVMRVRLFPSFTQTQRETVFEHVPLERLCYGLDGNTLRAVASRRCHELHALGPDRTRYVSDFQLSGWLSGVVRLLLGARLEHGFGAMTDAIRRRSEEIAAAGR
jgi:hypothetical protein